MKTVFKQFNVLCIFSHRTLCTVYVVSTRTCLSYWSLKHENLWETTLHVSFLRRSYISLFMWLALCEQNAAKGINS
jgi:hypothetical protein